MRRLPNLPRLSCLALSTLLVAAGSWAHGRQTKAPDQELFPSIPASPMDKTPLTGQPYVFRLKYLDPAEMNPADASVAATLSPEVAKKAAQMSFDLDSPGWSYQQISCPAFPDYIFLAYRNAGGPEGYSRFVAALNRSGSPVLIVPSVAHGARLSSAWSNPSSYAIFNRILLEERGPAPLTRAPNWLVISMCYAEFTGNHVQALTSEALPDLSLDLARLGAMLPQLNLSPDRTAVVTFSDASEPKRTTNWSLSFNSRGQLTAVNRDRTRQPSRIALKP